MPRWHSRYKDPYYMPKNVFKRRPREYYAARTTIKLPEHLKPILEEYLKKPQPRFNKDDYLIMSSKHPKDSKEHQDLANFARSIAPDRRTRDGFQYIYLVKKDPQYPNQLALNPSTKDKLLPIIFKAIELGEL